MSTYFARTENLSDEELRKIYEQTPKEKLIDMLIEFCKNPKTIQIIIKTNMIAVIGDIATIRSMIAIVR